MGLLLELVGSWLGMAAGERMVVKKRQRDAAGRGRYVAMRESRMAKWLAGEVAVSPGRIDFTWHDMPKTESYDVIRVEPLGLGPSIIDGDTRIIAIESDTGTGDERVLFAILARDVEQVLASLANLR
ncbi:hypothetical protein [Georgenia soli]|nr:hypothetical protein [Georgenia soli]